MIGKTWHDLARPQKLVLSSFIRKEDWRGGFFVVFFDLESWCYSAEVGVASLFCKSPFAFPDKQDARIVALYRGVSQKVGFGSTALLNLQKLVGSVQSERCKRCFAKSLESATVWKCSFVHSHLCSAWVLIGMLPCYGCHLKVQHEILSTFPSGRRYIGSMVFHKTVMRWAPQLGSTKKGERMPKVRWRRARMMFYVTVISVILYWIWLYVYFFPNSTHFFCSAGHMSVIPKRKIWRSSTYLFLGGCCTVPLFRVKTNHDTKLLEHLVPLFWSALYHYRCRCSMLKFMVTGWSFVSTHPRHPGYFDSSKSSPWRVGPFNLPGSSINQWNETLSELGTTDDWF